VGCALLTAAWQPASPPQPPHIAARAWQATAQGRRADILITAHGYPDLSPARNLRGKAAKTRFVARALMDYAERAQGRLRADLRARGLDFVPLWLTNQIAVRNADRALLRWLATHEDVAHVDLDVKTRGVQYKPLPRPIPHSPLSIEWGVQRVNAPQVWALGYTGQGIVVANLDTGVRWDHNALKPNYRGWNGVTVTHDYNWFDAAPEFGPPSPVPQDLNGHGTHTTGTAVGNDGASNRIGVAPGARWIACRNMAGYWGIGSVARYVACFQFALAPTDVNGNSPNPDLSADITSNSWACDPNYGEEGCEVPTALITATQALRDAGIMVIAAAGNKGSECNTVNLSPATLDQAFTVGATNSSDRIAGFSSRGPSTLTGRLKPDVVAPGVGVRSALAESTNSYGSFSGTSMSTPHVAGVAALVWSAAPDLRGEVELTKDLLRRTARPLTTTTQTCGGIPGTNVPNNTYGYGLVDALAAVKAATLWPVVTAPPFAWVHEPLTVTLSVTNSLPITRNAVVISSTLSTAATFISASPPGTLNGNVLSWEFPTIAPSTTLSLTLVISSAQPGPLLNQAHLTFGGQSVPLFSKAVTTTILSERRIFPIVWLNSD
jgi:subtilisin family serine protease